MMLESRVIKSELSGFSLAEETAQFALGHVDNNLKDLSFKLLLCGPSRFKRVERHFPCAYYLYCVFVVVRSFLTQRLLHFWQEELRKTEIFSLDNYGQKSRSFVSVFFAPLLLRQNNFSSAIMRLTIEREREDSANAFTVAATLRRPFRHYPQLDPTVEQ